MKILFPTEFSSHATEVFKFASAIASNMNAEMIIVHAYGRPDLKNAVDSVNDIVLETKLKNAEMKMQEFENIEPNVNIKTSYRVKIGFSAETILDIAKADEVDLIVLGMTGKADTIDKLFGTTSLQILQEATCPVLLIPANANFADIENIIFTTNFEFSAIKCIDYLKKWRDQLNVNIDCIHIAQDEEMAEEAVKKLTILRNTYQNDPEIEFDMFIGDFEEEIEYFAKDKKADIIAMWENKKGFFKRLRETNKIKKIAQKISTPLLIIKDINYDNTQ